jgi:hypothetical protein
MQRSHKEDAGMHVAAVVLVGETLDCVTDGRMQLRFRCVFFVRGVSA